MSAEVRALVLLWLVGLCLRITVLAVPPVLPQLTAAFGLTQSAVAALTALPVVLFSLVAIPGSLLVSRFGAVRTLVAGILLCGLASGLRGAAEGITMLFATTFAMGIGIAIMQPALPAVVRDWVPRRVALGTAVYSNALLVGEAISASLTIPVVLPAVGQSWRASLVVWAVPVVAIGLLAGAEALRHRRASDTNTVAQRRWWPDWRDPLAWKLGLVMGFASSLYFATNAYLPGYVAARGVPDALGPALSALNWLQMPASILLLLFASRLMQRRWPFVVLSILSVVAIAGLLASPPGWIVAWSGLIGFCNAFMLILTLALPPLLAKAEDVSRLAAAVIAVGYLSAFVLPFLGGALWDATGSATVAFVPLLAFGVASAVIALTLRFE